MSNNTYAFSHPYGLIIMIITIIFCYICIQLEFYAENPTMEQTPFDINVFGMTTLGNGLWMFLVLTIAYTLSVAGE
eukprot:CAMPEP_0182563252 /NCGR_PEP_ID=MMETSP1324-20130603/5435_1 /TAXON_ID=236786 /ORGANISM="Florenciella sp., Strain RCC1587" /LENGTH=75 /DNA_ID=CAMNT_0024776401 /DNA_START=214 /DNA_END=441 /DNA_ORIENTATION=-